MTDENTFTFEISETMKMDAMRVHAQERLGIMGGSTFADVAFAAEDGGWYDALAAMTMAEISATIKVKAPKAGSNGKGKRLSKDEVGAVRAGALEALNGRPWCSKGQIAEIVNISPKKLGPQIKALKDAGQIIQRGERGTAEYALPGTEG